MFESTRTSLPTYFISRVQVPLIRMKNNEGRDTDHHLEFAANCTSHRQPLSSEWYAKSLSGLWIPGYSRHVFLIFATWYTFSFDQKKNLCHPMDVICEAETVMTRGCNNQEL
jgi:hypothetical protein